VDEVRVRPRQHLLPRVPERPLERRVERPVVTVEADDADQVERELEDPLDVALRPPPQHDRASDQEHDDRRCERPGERQPGERGLQPGRRLAAHVDAPAAPEHVEARAGLDRVERALDAPTVLADGHATRVATQRRAEPPARNERHQEPAAVRAAAEARRLEQVEPGLSPERPGPARADGEDARAVADRGGETGEARNVDAGTELRARPARERSRQVGSGRGRALEPPGRSQPRYRAAEAAFVAPAL
jgi:hypothetical protein